MRNAFRILVTVFSLSATAGAQPSVSIQDAIAMVRVPHFWGEQPFFAISPDGKSGAAVTWQGDVARNVNLYKVYVFDVASVLKSKRLPAPAAELQFKGDTNDYGFRITGVDRISAYTDPKTGNPVATFLHGEPHQVYALDGVTRKLRRLTNHPTHVRAYAMGENGELAIFAAEAGHTDQAQRDRLRQLARDSGVTIGDTAFFPPGKRWNYVLRNDMYVEDYVNPNLFEFFTLGSATAQPRLLFKTEKGGTPFISSSPDGHSAIFTPYHAGKDGGARFGLIDLKSRRISTLIDEVPGSVDYEFRRWLTRTPRHKDIDAADYPLTTGGGFPIWAPDGSTVLIYASAPKAKPTDTSTARWIEVGRATGRTIPLTLPPGWTPLAWDRATNSVIVIRGGAFGSIPRTGSGWGQLKTFGSAYAAPDAPAGELATPRFNPMYAFQANGQLALGVADNLAAAPEYAIFDFATRSSSIITDLNPELRNRRMGQVSIFRWKGPGADSAAFGFLVMPPNVQAGTRYPLALADRHSDNFGYILDGMGQYTAVAAQTLAAAGIAVMIIPEPQFPRGVVDTEGEGQLAQAYFASAVTALDKAGLIDAAKVGLLGGWSRAGFWTDYMIIHDPNRYAVASTVDGGSRNYIIERRWTHDQLMGVKTPLFLEPHGHFDIKKHGQYADILRDLGKPVDLLWLPTAPHDARIPSHRWRSLHMHTDWFRFWLQGYEDPNPAKRYQYERWRAMKKAK